MKVKKLEEQMNMLPKAALIAISQAIDKKQLDQAILNTKNLGYKPVYSKKVLSKFLFYAGSQKERVQQINDAFKNPEIKVIFAIRGGHGAVHVLENLNWDLIKKNPKSIVGYSDLTILLNYVYQITGKIQYHGPNLHLKFPKEDKSFFCLSNTLKQIPSNFSIKKSEILVEGKAKGIIVGGNLALLIRSLGTKYEIDTNNKILFIEAMDKFPAWIYDSLLQLKLAGKFNNCKGVILGDFLDCLDYEIYVDEFFKDFKIPIIKNQKFGHKLPNYTIPIGGNCLIDTQTKKWSIIQ